MTSTPHVFSPLQEYDLQIMDLESRNLNSHLPFQKCGSCGQMWNQWPDFIFDPAVRLLGFQAMPGLPDANLVIFVHCCGSTISILAQRLRHILPGPEQAGDLPSLFDTDMCNQYCRFIESLEACDRPCVNARDRRLILMLLRMKESDLEDPRRK
ncbi:MAG: hypothetical protein ABSC02_11500 [Acidobacteriota bacterium]